MKFSWHDLKHLLYIFLAVSGVGMIVTSCLWHYSHDPVAQLSAIVLFASGAGLVLFGLVAFFCRDDWEIWS